MSNDATNTASGMSRPDKQELGKTFLAGFMSSGEGWNGEWPFEQCGTEENIASVKETFEKWLSDPASVPEPNWGNK